MAPILMLRAEVYARALRARQNVRESGGIGGCAMRLMRAAVFFLCGAFRGGFVKRRATLLCGRERAVVEDSPPEVKTVYG